MSTTLNFKDTIDVPQWRPCAPANTATTAGAAMCNDMRNDVSADPFIWYVNNGLLYSYLPQNDGWIIRNASVNWLSTANGVGSNMVFHPSQGPRGTLTTGNTTTKVVLSTALPAAVGVDQLANNGSGLRGYKIRIVGNANGSSSGKTEEKFIIANTSGTTPTIILDSALSFTPASGDAYEILSGKIYGYGGGTAAGTVRSYDVATDFGSAALASPATGASSGAAAIVAFSELYVPSTSSPGLGFFGLLIATASSSASLTGTVAGADSALLADQYRNFQIRIVQDTGTPAAAGQRRKITTHTGGASPVYTVAAWTTTPSSTATFVIELDNDKLLMLNDGAASTFCYNISGNTWDSTTFAASASARGAGGALIAHSFGITLGTDLTNDTARHSHIFSFRGNGTATLDVFDISGATTGSWSSAITYGKSGPFPTGGAQGTYDPSTNFGKYYYVNAVGVGFVGQQNFRLDLKTRNLEPWTFLRYPGGVSLQAVTMACAPPFIDATTKLTFVYVLQHTSQNMFAIAAQR